MDEASVGRLLVLDFSELRAYQVGEEETGGGPPSGHGGGRKTRKYAGAAPICLLYLAEDVSPLSRLASERRPPV